MLQTTYEGRIYSLLIRAGETYPGKPPGVRFITKVNLPIVDSSGEVLASKYDVLGSWKSSTTFEQVLVGIEKVMKMNKSLKQPGEDETL